MALAIIFDSVGFGEWFILLAVVLVVVGPKKLPSAARTIGNYYSRFRRAADSFKRQLMDMETEFSKAAEEAEKGVDDAFKIDGDESSAVPSEEYDDPYGDMYPGEEEDPSGQDDTESREDAENGEESADDVPENGANDTAKTEKTVERENPDEAKAGA